MVCKDGKDFKVFAWFTPFFDKSASKRDASFRRSPRFLDVCPRLSPWRMRMICFDMWSTGCGRVASLINARKILRKFDRNEFQSSQVEKIVAPTNLFLIYHHKSGVPFFPMDSINEVLRFDEITRFIE